MLGIVGLDYASSFLRLELVTSIEERTKPANVGEVDSDRTERGPGVKRGKGSFAAPVLASGAWNVAKL